jgi:hypothetical protein
MPASLQGGESFSIDHPTIGWRLYEIIDRRHAALARQRSGSTRRCARPSRMARNRVRPAALHDAAGENNAIDGPVGRALDLQHGERRFCRGVSVVNLNAAELAVLESGQQRIGVFFRLETDPIVRIWLGVGNIEPGVNAYDLTGAQLQRVWRNPERAGVQPIGQRQGGAGRLHRLRRVRRDSGNRLWRRQRTGQGQARRGRARHHGGGLVECSARCTGAPITSRTIWRLRRTPMMRSAPWCAP